MSGHRWRPPWLKQFSSSSGTHENSVTLQSGCHITMCQQQDYGAEGRAKCVLQASSRRFNSSLVNGHRNLTFSFD